MSSPDYQVIYGVTLLDDIHNYFPALLYEHGRFQNLAHILSYVRNQMNTRFNLFSYGASLHRESTIPAVPVQTSTPLPRSRDSVLASSSLLLSLLGLTNLDSLRIIQPAMGSMASPDIWAAFTAPVPVVPSPEVISANTEIVDVSNIPLTQITCSICQDSMRSSEECRRLKPCQHTFHRVCIDQWFLRSVMCPHCRHDIRIATASPRLGATPTETVVPEL